MLRVALISYDSGVEGSVTSEWVKDKITGLKELGYHVTLVTSECSSLQSDELMRVVKIGSFSKNDRLHELERTGKTHRDLTLSNKIFGGIFDSTFRFLAGNRSDGRWSWALTSFPVLTILLARTNFHHIIATGGPSAAHVATTAACKVLRKRAILEFQDPFIPLMVKMSPLAAKVLQKIEVWLLSESKKFALVTNEAAKTVQGRHPNHRRKIIGCLPGSPKLVDSATAQFSSGGKQVVFTHLGTLYDSRNFRNIDEALRRAFASKSISPDEILFQNIGGDASQEFDIYSQNYFKSRLAVTRVKGLEIASKSNYLVIIQHTDDRSLDTIPYKTYDYLNLEKPIFGLVRNTELKKIIDEHGGITADPRDVEEIESSIIQAVLKLRREPEPQPESKIDFLSQLKTLLREP